MGCQRTGITMSGPVPNQVQRSLPAGGRQRTGITMSEPVPNQVERFLPAGASECPLVAFGCQRTGKMMSDPVTYDGGETIDRSAMPFIRARVPEGNAPLKKAIDIFCTSGDLRRVAEEAMKCPLSHCLMTDPVTDFTTGETYEKSWIQGYLARNSLSPYRSPSIAFRPNAALKMAIDEICVLHPDLKEDPPPPPQAPTADDVLLEHAKRLNCSALLVGSCKSQQCSGCGVAAVALSANPRDWMCPWCFNFFEPEHIYSLPGADWELKREYLSRGKWCEDKIIFNGVHAKGFRKQVLTEEGAQLSRLSDLCIRR